MGRGNPAFLLGYLPDCFLDILSGLLRCARNDGPAFAFFFTYGRHGGLPHRRMQIWYHANV